MVFSVSCTLGVFSPGHQFHFQGVFSVYFHSHFYPKKTQLDIIFVINQTSKTTWRRKMKLGDGEPPRILLAGSKSENIARKITIICIHSIKEVNRSRSFYFSNIIMFARYVKVIFLLTDEMSIDVLRNSHHFWSHHAHKNYMSYWYVTISFKVYQEYFYKTLRLIVSFFSE